MIYEKCYSVTFDPDCDNQVQCESEAIDFAQGYVWSEEETSEQNIAHANHIETINDIGVHYCYGTDHFFFTDETE